MRKNRKEGMRKLVVVVLTLTIIITAFFILNSAMKQRMFDLQGSNSISAFATKTDLSGSGNAELETAYQEIQKHKDKITSSDTFLLVDGKTQTLMIIEKKTDGFEINKKYAVSTAKKGFGTITASEKTPTGVHMIKGLPTQEADLGEIIENRQATGRNTKIYTDNTNIEQDLITTRVIEIEGLEEKNKNSNSRGILIHGTPEEGLIGTPQSHGCIRMRNKDVIEFSKLVKIGMPLLMVEDLSILGDHKITEATRKSSLPYCQGGDIQKLSSVSLERADTKRCYQYLDLIKEELNSQGLSEVDPLFIMAIMSQESGCNPNLNDGGIMQVDQCLGNDDWNCRDPKEGIMRGIQEFKQKYDSLKDLDINRQDLAEILLYSYNRGMSGLKDMIVSSNNDVDEGMKTHCETNYGKGSSWSEKYQDLDVYSDIREQMSSYQYFCEYPGHGLTYPSVVLDHFRDACIAIGGNPLMGMSEVEQMIEGSVYVSKSPSSYYVNPSFRINFPYDFSVYDELSEKAKKLLSKCSANQETEEVKKCVEEFIEKENSGSEQKETRENEKKEKDDKSEKEYEFEWKLFEGKSEQTTEEFMKSFINDILKCINSRDNDCYCNFDMEFSRADGDQNFILSIKNTLEGVEIEQIKPSDENDVLEGLPESDLLKKKDGKTALIKGVSLKGLPKDDEEKNPYQEKFIISFEYDGSGKIEFQRDDICIGHGNCDNDDWFLDCDCDERMPLNLGMSGELRYHKEHGTLTLSEEYQKIGGTAGKEECFIGEKYFDFKVTDKNNKFFFYDEELEEYKIENPEIRFSLKMVKDLPPEPITYYDVNKEKNPTGAIDNPLSQKSILLQWKDPRDTSISKYRIYFVEGEEFSYPKAEFIEVDAQLPRENTFSETYGDPFLVPGKGKIQQGKIDGEKVNRLLNPSLNIYYNERIGVYDLHLPVEKEDTKYSILVNPVSKKGLERIPTEENLKKYDKLKENIIIAKSKDDLPPQTVEFKESQKDTVIQWNPVRQKMDGTSLNSDRVKYSVYCSKEPAPTEISDFEIVKRDIESGHIRKTEIKDICSFEGIEKRNVKILVVTSDTDGNSFTEVSDMNLFDCSYDLSTCRIKEPKQIEVYESNEGASEVTRSEMIPYEEGTFLLDVNNVGEYNTLVWSSKPAKKSHLFIIFNDIGCEGFCLLEDRENIFRGPESYAKLYPQMMEERILIAYSKDNQESEEKLYENFDIERFVASLKKKIQDSELDKISVILTGRSACRNSNILTEISGYDEKIEFLALADTCVNKEVAKMISGVDTSKIITVYSKQSRWEGEERDEEEFKKELGINEVFVPQSDYEMGLCRQNKEDQKYFCYKDLPHSLAPSNTINYIFEEYLLSN